MGSAVAPTPMVKTVNARTLGGISRLRPCKPSRQSDRLCLPFGTQSPAVARFPLRCTPSVPPIGRLHPSLPSLWASQSWLHSCATATAAPKPRSGKKGDGNRQQKLPATLLLIGADGENRGELTSEEAAAAAKAAGCMLRCVGPQAKPPVFKLFSHAELKVQAAEKVRARYLRYTGPAVAVRPCASPPGQETTRFPRSSPTYGPLLFHGAEKTRGGGQETEGSRQHYSRQGNPPEL